MDHDNSIPKSDQGFTLIESLIAIIILGILMTGGLAFYYHANALYYRSLHLQMATWAADTEMEQIKNEGCAAAITDPSTSSTVVSLTGDSSDTSHLTGQRTVGLPTPCSTSALNDVSVTVVWSEQGEPAGSHNVFVETYVEP